MTKETQNSCIQWTVSLRNDFTYFFTHGYQSSYVIFQLACGTRSSPRKPLDLAVTVFYVLHDSPIDNIAFVA